MRNLLYPALAALTCATCGCSPRGIYVNKQYAAIPEYGRYKATVVGTVPNAASSGGVMMVGTSTEHVETTLDIPCKIGESFGFFLALTRKPASECRLRIEIHHPPITQPDGRVMTLSVQEVVLGPDEVILGPLLWDFAKGYEYEFVPGKWTRKVYADGILVASGAFNVRKWSR